MQIFVKTNAKQNSLQFYEDSVHVWIKKAPVKGKANKEIIKYLAKEFGIHRNDIQIVHGIHATTKIVEMKITLDKFLTIVHLHKVE